MLLNVANEGDIILTLEVSCLMRSTQQLCEIVETIKQKWLRLVIVDRWIAATAKSPP